MFVVFVLVIQIQKCHIGKIGKINKERVCCGNNDPFNQCDNIRIKDHSNVKPRMDYPSIEKAYQGLFYPIEY